jgi:hypothetical protein
MTLPDTAAADATFRLPVATRAAAAAGAPQMAALLDELLHLCGEEPVTAVLAVTEALARRHSTQCVWVLSHPPAGAGNCNCPRCGC